MPSRRWPGLRLATPSVMPDERISEVRDYYRSILPFYQLESVNPCRMKVIPGVQ